MITTKELRESIDTKRLTSLVRAGIFDSSKLPLLKRLLDKDVNQLNSNEKESMKTLLDNLLSQVLDNTQVYNKVKSNLQNESLNEKYEGHELPAVLILKRKAVRQYPDGQKIYLYYSDKLDTFISIPVSGITVVPSSVNEETYEQHKEINAEYTKKAKDTGDKLKKYKRNSNGITPDSEKTDQWHKDRDEAGKAFSSMQNHNSFMVKHFKKEMQAERNNRKPINEKITKDTSMQAAIDDFLKSKSHKLSGLSPKQRKDAAIAAVMKQRNLKETLDESVHGALKAIVANKQAMPVKFQDGKTMKVDLFTASKILNIHDTVHDQNKEKMVTMMNHSKEKFMKVASFAHKH